MAITALVENLSKRINPQGVDLTTATIKCALFLSTSNIAVDSTTYSLLTNEVANENGYTTGGVTITDLTWSGTTSPLITGTIPTWTSSTFTFRYIVLYDSVSDKVIGYYNCATDQSVVAGTVTLTFDTDGMIKVTST
jgi:hypothetical protein